MSIQFDLPTERSSIIKVVGVGGGGTNAVNHMYNCGIIGVNFIVCNTDAQSLQTSPVPNQVQLGPSLTDGMGAGSQPNVGRDSTIESIEDIKQAIGENTKMVFVTAGMGGGTGTGGAPIVAKAMKELGVLTVGIVTTPFGFEGPRRMQQALEGLEEMKSYVDSLIVISNDKLKDIYGNLGISEAFSKADDVLTTAAKGIAEIITVPGIINVDFKDVNTVLRNSGAAIMGAAYGEGEDRAINAAKGALASPLLNDTNIKGAQYLLVNITYGKKEALMDEITEITTYIQKEAGNNADLIFGTCIDESIDDKLCVTIIATGFEIDQKQYWALRPDEKRVVHLDDDPMEENPHIEAVRQRQSVRRKGDKIVYDFESSTKEVVPQPIEEPSAVDGEFDDAEVKRMKETLKERRNRLKGLSNLKFQSATALGELEREPAYKRRNVELENVPEKGEEGVSRYSLSDGDDNRPTIKKRNPFIHDNVD